MAKHNFKEIKAWQKAKALVPLVYHIVKVFPSDEKYALTSQIKRAAVSISSNIAEGSGRNTTNDFAHFLDIALGSAFELESELLVAIDLMFTNEEKCISIFKELDETQKLIVGFQNYLRK